jgi:hypothetical protein
MKKILMLMVIFCAMGATLTAQEEGTKKDQTPPRDVLAKQAAAPAYKLAFAIYELQGGKKINERDYSVLLRADNNSNKLKIGTRVPIDIGEGKITYADVGFDMDCSAVETVDGKVSVRIDTTVTNFALPEQNTDPRTAGSRPVLRGVTQRVHTILSPGKPQIVTSMDDVNSNKRMQVEVTATKVD